MEEFVMEERKTFVMVMDDELSTRRFAISQIINTNLIYSF